MQYRVKLNLDFLLSYKGVKVIADDLTVNVAFPRWFRGDDRDTEIIAQEPYKKQSFDFDSDAGNYCSLWLVKLTIQNRFRPWTRRELYRLRLVKKGDPWYGNALYLEDIYPNLIKHVGPDWCWRVLHAYEDFCRLNNRKPGDSVLSFQQYYQNPRKKK